MVDFSLPSPPRRLEDRRRVLLDVQNMEILRCRTITVQRCPDALGRLLRVSLRLSRLNLRSRLLLLRTLQTSVSYQRTLSHTLHSGANMADHMRLSRVPTTTKVMESTMVGR
jgi:hypothetical protein